MDSIEMKRRLEVLWQRAVDNIASPDQDLLDRGGYLRAVGSADLVEAWLRGLTASRGVLVLRLDLDGWEPGQPDLSAYAAYQSAVRRISGDFDLQGSGARDAGRLSLEMDQDSPQGVQDLQQALERLGQEAPVAVLVPCGDVLPENVRQVLARTCTAGSRRLWVDVHPVGEPGDLQAEVSDMGQEPAAPVAHLEKVCDPVLRRALGHWALMLAGSTGSAPLEPVLTVLGLDEDARERIIDHVDDELVEGEATELLRDLQFLHPSFTDAVYCPAHPLWASFLTHGWSPDQQRQAASVLLSELRRRLKPGRGSFVLLLRLAEQCGDQDAAARLRLRLRWWSDGRDLDSVIEHALEAGTVSTDELWTLAGESFWPAGHRLSFLEAWTRADGAPAKAGDAEVLRAEILHRAQQLPEALDAVRKALEIQGLNHGPRSKPYLAALHLCSLLLMEVEEIEVGLEQLELCEALASELLSEDDPKRLMIIENRGKALVRGGRLRQARESFEEVLRLTEQSRGSDHSATAVQRNNLAGLLIEIGELEQARRQLLEAARVLESTLGNRSMELYGALRNLAHVTDEMQDDEGTKELLERLAPLEESLLGSSHPNLLTTWTRLAELRRDEGDRDGARFLFERALELSVELFYGEHPSIPALEAALSELS